MKLHRRVSRAREKFPRGLSRASRPIGFLEFPYPGVLCKLAYPGQLKVNLYIVCVRFASPRAGEPGRALGPLPSPFCKRPLTRGRYGRLPHGLRRSSGRGVAACPLVNYAAGIKKYYIKILSMRFYAIHREVTLYVNLPVSFILYL